MAQSGHPGRLEAVCSCRYRTCRALGLRRQRRMQHSLARSPTPIKRSTSKAVPRCVLAPAVADLRQRNLPRCTATTQRCASHRAASRVRPGSASTAGERFLFVYTPRQDEAGRGQDTSRAPMAGARGQWRCIKTRREGAIRGPLNCGRLSCFSQPRVGQRRRQLVPKAGRLDRTPHLACVCGCMGVCVGRGVGCEPVQRLCSRRDWLA